MAQRPSLAKHFGLGVIGLIGLCATAVALEAPTALTRTSYSASPRSITLGWTDNSSTETEFDLEKSGDGGATWSSFGTALANATTFSGTLPADQTMYLFRLRASDGTLYSAYSNTISVEGNDPAVTDTDGDGMPDAYELAHGLDPYVDDSYEDIDGDRYPNIVEYIKGTNVADAASKPTADLIVDGTATNHDNVYSTLQGALNQVSSDFQVVQVKNGTYGGTGNVNLSVSGSHAVLLISQNGAASTVVDGSGTTRLITLGTSAIIDGLTMRNGSADNGAALKIQAGSVLLVNCVFSGNQASQYGGAVYQLAGQTLTVHSTFLNNSATTAGNGIYAESGTLTLDKSILWDGGAGTEIGLSGSASATVIESIVTGSYSGTGNSGADPTLVPDGHLKAGSPAIDRGGMLLTSLVDMDGEVRPSGTTSDIGADEWVDTDGNGLPNWWQNKYYGHLGNSASGDTDVDGLTNLQEYMGGSDPQNYFSQSGTLMNLTLTVVSGSGQTGEPSTFAALPLIVQLQSGTTLLNNAPLTFSVTGSGLVASGTGGTLYSSLLMRTGSNGQAQVNFKFPATYSTTNTIQATATGGANAASVNFTESTPAFPQSGLSLWLRADTGVTVVSGTNKVSAWADQSGNVNTGTQATSAAQPIWVDNVINGKPVMRFTGSQQIVFADSTSLKPSKFTILAVVKQNTSTDVQTLISRPYFSSTTWVTSPYVSYMCRTLGSGSSDYLRSAVTISGTLKATSIANKYDLTKVHVLGWKFDGTSQQLYRGGYPMGSLATSGTIDYGSTTSISMGARSSFSPGDYLNADVAEVLFYSRALPPSEQKQAESYLISKYGLQNYDTEGDGMSDGYEENNGLNPLVDDTMLDKDGDGVPNQWEYAKGTAAGTKSDFTPDYIVDPGHANDSSTDNVVGTITAAINLVPVASGTTSLDYKTIYVKKGEYAEKVSIPSNKRIALVGERSATPVRLVGVNTAAGLADVVVDIRGRSVMDGFFITRPTMAIAAGTVTGRGVYIVPDQARITNCIITGHNTGIYAENGSGFTAGATTIDHCTIYGNGSGGGLSWYNQTGSPINIVGSILWNPSGTTEIYRYFTGGNAPAVTSSIIRSGTFGGINSDPLLKANGMLSAGSPAINADTSTAVIGGDIEGDLRPYGSARDIGADEYVDSDNDGLPDSFELEYFGNLSQTATGDPDLDGLNNLGEYVAGTNPNVTDTDGDGASDAQEASNGSDSHIIDTDGDGMNDGYEENNGLNPLVDDTILDKDGDGVPNQWEYLKGTASGTKSDFTPDYIVDPAHANDSSTDNIVGTITAAINLVPVATGTTSLDYKTILVKKGEYAENVTLPANKRIALVGERSSTLVKIIGSGSGNTQNDFVLQVYGRSVVDGFVLTRPAAAIAAGTVVSRGVYLVPDGARITNCIITGHNTGIYAENGSGFTAGATTIDHCTIYSNGSGGGLSWYNQTGSPITIASSILWDPAATTEIGRYFSSSPTVISSIIRGGQFGGINSDPLLRTNGTLSVGSPAIDADTSTAVVGGDIEGDARPYGSARDIGADEYVDSDNDGLPDSFELEYFGNLSKTATGDADLDGLNNLGEYLAGTNPNIADTDGDGANDAQEASAGSDSHVSDTDGDGMTDGYEENNGLNALVDDTLLDKDGDGVPNRWENLKGTDAGDKASFTPDYIVDPAHANDSSTDNIVGTISAAINLVPVVSGTDSVDYKTIYVKKGEYAEKVYLPSNKRIALVGERSSTPVKLVGPNTSAGLADYVLDLRGRNVVDGFIITRPTSAIAAGTVTGTGVYLVLEARLTNCMVSNHATGIYIYNAAAYPTGPVIDHCTIFNNGSGGGIYWYDVAGTVAPTIVSSIVWDPVAITCYSSSYSPIVISSLVRGGQFGGVNNVPRFNADGWLSAGSPAIDADTGTAAVGGDIEGHVRPYGTARDIGADEYVDSDNDGLPDSWELRWFGDLTQTSSADTDNDGISNLLEFLLDLDPTVPNSSSELYNAIVKAEKIGVVFPDTDGDRLNDAWEVYYHTNPNLVDTNGDGISDYESLQLAIDPTSNDSDGDGLTNAQEIAQGTSPILADSDHDGVNDNVDWYPNDPTRSAAPATDSSDHTGPVMTLDQPDGVILTP